MLAQAIQALTDLGQASGVARSAPVYALVSAVHILGIALLIGPILLADLRLAGIVQSLDEKAVRILRRTARVGVVLVLLTGVLLLSAKPAEYAVNRVVWFKLAVVAIGLLNAVAFEFRVLRHGLPALLVGAGRMAAIASIILWLSALLLGRWIAFV